MTTKKLTFHGASRNTKVGQFSQPSTSLSQGAPPLTQHQVITPIHEQSSSIDAEQIDRQIKELMDKKAKLVEEQSQESGNDHVALEDDIHTEDEVTEPTTKKKRKIDETVQPKKPKGFRKESNKKINENTSSSRSAVQLALEAKEGKVQVTKKGKKKEKETEESICSVFHSDVTRFGSLVSDLQQLMKNRTCNSNKEVIKVDDDDEEDFGRKNKIGEEDLASINVRKHYKPEMVYKYMMDKKKLDGHEYELVFTVAFDYIVAFFNRHEEMPSRELIRGHWATVKKVFQDKTSEATKKTVAPRMIQGLVDRNHKEFLDELVRLENARLGETRPEEEKQALLEAKIAFWADWLRKNYNKK